MVDDVGGPSAQDDALVGPRARLLHRLPEVALEDVVRLVGRLVPIGQMAPRIDHVVAGYVGALGEQTRGELAAIDTDLRDGGGTRLVDEARPELHTGRGRGGPCAKALFVRRSHPGGESLRYARRTAECRPCRAPSFLFSSRKALISRRSVLFWLRSSSFRSANHCARTARSPIRSPRSASSPSAISSARGYSVAGSAFAGIGLP